MSDYYHDNYYRIDRHIRTQIEKAQTALEEAQTHLKEVCGGWGEDEARAALGEARGRLEVLTELSEELEIGR